MENPPIQERIAQLPPPPSVLARLWFLQGPMLKVNLHDSATKTITLGIYVPKRLIELYSPSLTESIGKGLDGKVNTLWILVQSVRDAEIIEVPALLSIICYMLEMMTSGRRWDEVP